MNRYHQEHIINTLIFISDDFCDEKGETEGMMIFRHIVIHHHSLL